MRDRPARLSVTSLGIVLVCLAISTAAATYAAVGSPAPGSSLFRVPDAAMLPSLAAGDRVLTDAGGTVTAGSVVVIEDPTGERDVVVRRVIATPGQTVAIYGDTVYIDERPESALCSVLLPTKKGVHALPTTVPEGALWVMGDNRGASTDSRLYGSVSRGSVRGVVTFVCWPPEHVDVVSDQY